MDATVSALAPATPDPARSTTTGAKATHLLPPTSTYTSALAAATFNTLTSRTFLTEPLTVILCLEASKPPNNTLTTSDIHSAFTERTARKLADGGLIIEAGDWAAAAIWDPPGSLSMGRSLSPAEQEARPIFAHFTESNAAAKRKYLGEGQKYWHLSMMARDPLVQPPVKGAVRAVIEPYLLRARVEGLPVWIEAGNVRARDVYGYMGFEVLEEVKMGEGTHRADGFPADVGGGEEAPGVLVWFMCYNRGRAVVEGVGEWK